MLIAKLSCFLCFQKYNKYHNMLPKKEMQVSYYYSSSFFLGGGGGGCGLEWAIKSYGQLNPYWYLTTRPHKDEKKKNPNRQPWQPCVIVSIQISRAVTSSQISYLVSPFIDQKKLFSHFLRQPRDAEHAITKDHKAFPF